MTWERFSTSLAMGASAAEAAAGSLDRAADAVNRATPPPKPECPPNILSCTGAFGTTTRPAPVQQIRRRSHWDAWLERTLRDSSEQVAEWLRTWPHAQLLGADLPYLESVWSVMPPNLQGYHRTHNPELAAILDRPRCSRS